MKAKIIAVERHCPDQASVRIDFGKGMVLWFDVYKDSDGEITGDWNKFIFRTYNEQDMAEKAFQDASNDEAGAYNYATALELAEAVL